MPRRKRIHRKKRASVAVAILERQTAGYKRFNDRLKALHKTMQRRIEKLESKLEKALKK